MASVDEGTGVDDVLEIESATGTLKSPSAAALRDGMLAASVKLYPGQYVRIPLRFEFVRRREGSHTGPPLRLPTITSSPLSRYTPLGISLAVSTFAYKQP
jgi:hypothetical protein